MDHSLLYSLLYAFLIAVLMVPWCGCRNEHPESATVATGEQKASKNDTDAANFSNEIISPSELGLRIREGERLNFVVRAADGGRSFGSKDWSGNIVLVNFWATWCASCQKEIEILSALHRRYADEGLRILGISVDGDAGALRFWLAAKKIPYPVGGYDDDVEQAFGRVNRIPITIMLDRQGIVSKIYPGSPKDPERFERDIKDLLALAEREK